MANRQQRRAAKKRPGETYADVLAKKKMIQKAVEQSVHDNAVELEADIKVKRFLWMAVIALNEEFGFGGERAKRFMVAVQEVSDEDEARAKKHGKCYAQQKLIERASQITGIDITPVHEETMRRAREENQKNGIYFREDRDVW